MQLWKKTDDFIRTYQSDSSFEMAHNKFSDWTDEEKKKYLVAYHESIRRVTTQTGRDKRLTSSCKALALKANMSGFGCASTVTLSANPAKQIQFSAQLAPNASTQR